MDFDRDDFRPPWYLRNGHVQTILNSQGPKKHRAGKIARSLQSQRLTLEAKDGVKLLADFDRAPVGKGALVVLIHGWEGSSQSSYQLTTAATLLNMGFDVLRLNLRDHGDSHHLNPGLFNSTLTGEASEAIGHFLAMRSYPRVCLAGYSLGGSFALRIAADAGVELGITAVAAVCAPIEPCNAMRALNEGWFVYERYFFRKWTRSLHRKLQHFPQLEYGDDLKKARRLDDINRMFIPAHTPYRDAEEYFAAYALSGKRLINLSMPAWLVLAADDPIIPVADVSNIAAEVPLQIQVTRHGGHCGFIENLRGDSWIEKWLVELFTTCLD